MLSGKHALIHYLLSTGTYSWLETGMDIWRACVCACVCTYFYLFYIHHFICLNWAGWFSFVKACMQYPCASAPTFVCVMCTCEVLLAAISGVCVFSWEATGGPFTSPDGSLRAFSRYLDGGRGCVSVWACAFARDCSFVCANLPVRAV